MFQWTHIKYIKEFFWKGKSNMEFPLVIQISWSFRVLLFDRIPKIQPETWPHHRIYSHHCCHGHSRKIQKKKTIRCTVISFSMTFRLLVGNIVHDTFLREKNLHLRFPDSVATLLTQKKLGPLFEYSVWHPWSLSSNKGYVGRIQTFRQGWSARNANVFSCERRPTNKSTPWMDSSSSVH